MKLFLFSILCLSFSILQFSFTETFPQKKTAFSIIRCDSVPELNKGIINFLKDKINKKVGRGECWDLAAEALKTVDAKWDKKFMFGREINYKTECVFEGDIIQFEGVKVKYKIGNSIYSESLQHHTAIIYKVKTKGDFVLCEQNTNVLGKKVGFSDLQIENIIKGKIKIYRPTN